MLKNNQTFSTKTWNQFCAAQVSTAVPGALEFTKYADSKGVKIFYITNRGAETEKDTRENMAKLGFPMGGNVDTFLMQGEKPEWGGAKGTRRAVVTKDYRVLLNIGDNFGGKRIGNFGTTTVLLNIIPSRSCVFGRARDRVIAKPVKRPKQNQTD